MKLTSTDALRINEIRQGLEAWDALEVEEQVELASDRAIFASADVRVLLELIDRIVPDCFELTASGRAALGEE